MILGIMQPYLFPYLGYFQLIEAVDEFVVYDDVNFIKGGWVNRNYILANNQKQLFTLQLNGASPNKKINEITVGKNANKLLKSINQAYSKAPYFNNVFPLIQRSFENSSANKISQVAENSIRNVCEYLSIDTKIVTASNLYSKTSDLKRAERIYKICELTNSNVYINTINGQELYDKSQFKKKGITLNFLSPGSINYKQYDNTFIPYLSIIDVLMFNEKSNVCECFLPNYKLV